MFQEMMPMSQGGGGDTLNPTNVGHDSYQTGTVTYNCDLSKRYMVDIVEVRSNAYYLGSFYVDKGTLTTVLKTTDWDSYMSVSIDSSGVLTISRLTSLGNYHYLITQLD